MGICMDAGQAVQNGMKEKVEEARSLQEGHASMRASRTSR